MMAGRVKRHFVQIEYMREQTRVLYRFFGLGEWKVKDGRNWRTVNAIYVPGDVLSVAARAILSPASTAGTKL